MTPSWTRGSAPIRPTSKPGAPCGKRSGSCGRTPTPLFKDIEARIQRGEDLAGLVTQMREQPERFGDLRGQEEARSLLARLMPESAAVAAGRAERGAARVD